MAMRAWPVSSGAPPTTTAFAIHRLCWRTQALDARRALAASPGMPGDAAKALRASKACVRQQSRWIAKAVVVGGAPDETGQALIAMWFDRPGHVRQGARRSCEHGGKRVHAASLRAS